MPTDYFPTTKHRFQLINGKVADGCNLAAPPPRITLSQESIRVGCAVITVEAARHILDEWEKRFGGPETVELQ